MTNSNILSAVLSDIDAPLLITILGPTACGKTALAVEVAARVGGEVISADSRQVYRGMDLGTGKDLADYTSRQIPYHLIDICHPTEEYSAYRFMGDFAEVFSDIVQRGKRPILCGGTGLYVDAVVRGYQLSNAPVDDAFRAASASRTDEELIAELASYGPLHNHTDTETRQRLLRAIEIQRYATAHPDDYIHLPAMRHVVFGLLIERDRVIERIRIRLDQRLSEGMVEEVQRLLDVGVPAERLLRMGLEYRHLTRYILHECSFEEMHRDLFTDIRRFAKRQMTWFRRMERNGVHIHWLDASRPTSAMADALIATLPPHFLAT